VREAGRLPQLRPRYFKKRRAWLTGLAVSFGSQRISRKRWNVHLGQIAEMALFTKIFVTTSRLRGSSTLFKKITARPICA